MASKINKEKTVKENQGSSESPLLATSAEHTEGIQNDSQSPTLENEQSEMNASTHQVNRSCSNPFEFSDTTCFRYSPRVQKPQETNTTPMEVPTKPPEPQYACLPCEPVSSVVDVFPVREINLQSDASFSCCDMYPITTPTGVRILPKHLRKSVNLLVSHNDLSFLFIHLSNWRYEKLIDLQFNYDATCRFNCSLPPTVAPLHVQPPDVAVHSWFTESVKTIVIFPAELLRPLLLVFDLKKGLDKPLALQFEFKASARKLNCDMEVILIKAAIIVPAIYDDLKHVWTPAVRIPVIIPYAFVPSSSLLLPLLENMFLIIERVQPSLALQIVSTPPSMHGKLFPETPFHQNLEGDSLTANEGQMGHMEPTYQEDCKRYNEKEIPFERRVEEQVLYNPITAPSLHQNLTSAKEVPRSNLQDGEPFEANMAEFNTFREYM